MTRGSLLTFLVATLALVPACDQSNDNDGDSCPPGQVREGGLCVPDDDGQVAGCTDSDAANYDPAATTFDGSCTYDVLFQVDLSGVSLAGSDVVYLRGDFNDFAATADALVDDDDDDVWTATLSLAPGTYEYKYAINDIGSGGTDEVVPPECDYDTSDDDRYRGFQLGSAPLAIPVHVFGGCSATAGPGCTDPDAANYDDLATVENGSCTYNVTFSVDMACSGESPTTVAISGPFCSWCDSGFELTDGDSDGVWTGTYAFPPGKLEYKYMVDQFSSQEDLVSDMVDGATCAPITDYSSYANRELTVADAPVTANDTYGHCDGCPTGGAGCTDSDAWNYDSSATTDDGSCKYEVTFSVDMRCAGSFTTPYVTGPFCSWCDNGFPLSDGDGDGIWTGTYPFAPGNLEFKYMVDSFAGQEDLVDDMQNGGSCAPITDYSSYANRQIAVVDAPVTADGTYGSCDACTPTGAGCTDADASNYDSGAGSDDGSCVYAVNFSLDLSCFAGSFTTPYIAGPFNGWCADCHPLADGDGDDIWTATYDFAPGALEYKYQLDAWAAQEDLVDDMQNGGSCAPVTDYSSYANRQITIVDAPVSPVDTYDQCSSCP